MQLSSETQLGAEIRDQMAMTNELERTLTALWQDVLGLDRAPAPDENFFDLGGDSLLAVRLAGQARAAGLDLRARTVFETQTIAELAKAAIGALSPSGVGVSDDAVLLRLLPAQERWLDNDIPEVDYWNLDVLLTCPAGVSRRNLEDVARALLLRHEALATRYQRTSSGEWIASRISVDDEMVGSAVVQHSLPRRTDELQARLITEHKSLSLNAGKVFRLVHFDAGDRDGRLLVLIHHLTADGVSMSTVIDDAEAALGASLDGIEPSLPPATAPSLYGRAVAAWTSTEQAAQDARRWRMMSWGDVGVVPTDYGGAGLVTSNRTVRVMLDAEVTRFFMSMRRGARSGGHDAVLCAVVAAVANWTGHPTHAVDVYDQNRADPLGDLDLARTVGYVQSTYPVVLSTGSVAGSDTEAVRSMCRQLRDVPDRTFGFDALRYLPGDPHRLRDLPAPQIRHNFRGSLARVIERRGALLQEAEEDTVANRSPLQAERYKLMIEGDIVDRQLMIGIRYSSLMYEETTVRRLVDHAASVLERLVAEG